MLRGGKPLEGSKISSVEVHNFMAYKYAKVYFDETGILNIKGFNSSGKSAFEMAIAICLMNILVSKQGNFIRHGERYFRIVVNFDDGISIVRDKYDNGQSLYEMYKDGECIFTTKQGNKLAKVSGVPSPIKKYLDLIETDIGYLNYQTCKDPLWLVETKGAENYNSLNEVLKTQEISRANAMLNSDINSLNSEIAMIEAELQRKELQLEACKGVSRELVDALADKELEVKLLSEKDSSLDSMLKGISEISSISLPCEMERISSKRLKALEDLQKTLVELNAIQVPAHVDTVNTKRLASLEALSSTASNKELNTSIGEEVSKVDCKKQSKLSDIYKELKQCAAINKELNSLIKEEEKLTSEKALFVEEARKEGKIFVECENCGTLMEVNTNES